MYVVRELTIHRVMVCLCYAYFALHYLTSYQSHVLSEQNLEVWGSRPTQKIQKKKQKLVQVGALLYMRQPLKTSHLPA